MKKSAQIQFVKKQIDDMETELDQFYAHMKSLCKGWRETLEIISEVEKNG